MGPGIAKIRGEVVVLYVEMYNMVLATYNVRLKKNWAWDNFSTVSAKRQLQAILHFRQKAKAPAGYHRLGP